MRRFVQRFGVFSAYALAAAPMVAACGSPSGQEATGSAGEAIVNGAVDNGHPYVVELLGPGTEGCSGVLVTSRSVLTAGHCADLGNPLTQRVLVGGVDYQVVTTILNPGYTPGGPPENDLAVAILDRSVVGVDPVNLMPVPPQLEDPVVIVGYGYTAADANNFGVKRYATNTIDVLNDLHEFSYGIAGTNGLPCSGDSGGAWLLAVPGEQRLTGITSSTDGTCTVVARAMRVDPYLEWISSVIAPDPIPQFVAIRAFADHNLVTAESAGAAPLIANRTAIGQWEVFDVEDHGDGTVSLRSMVNFKYVTAESQGAKPLIANRDVVGPWETFDWIPRGGHDFALRAHANGKIVCAESAGASSLIANRTAIGPWETFTYIPNDPVFVTPPASITMTALANNELVTAESAGALPLIANRTAAGQWETFEVQPQSGEQVALLSMSDGRYVTAESAGASPLIANRTAVGPWETFDWLSLGAGHFALRAHANGQYVCAENGGASSLIANRSRVGPWETFVATPHVWTPPAPPPPPPPPPGCTGTVCGSNCCAASDWCGTGDRCCSGCTPGCPC
jgi:hypothetical protein